MLSVVPMTTPIRAWYYQRLCHGITEFQTFNLWYVQYLFPLLRGIHGLLSYHAYVYTRFLGANMDGFVLSKDLYDRQN